jgi:hypothetical protein
MNSQVLSRGDGGLMKRVGGKGVPPARALETIFLAVLSRRPTEDESARLLLYMAERKDHSSACRDVAWILLNSAEFVFNH